MQTCKKIPKVLKERNEILFLFNPYENGFITRNEMGGRWRKVKLRCDKCNKIFEQEHYERDNSQQERSGKGLANGKKKGICQVRACTFFFTVNFFILFPFDLPVRLGFSSALAIALFWC